MDNLTQKTAKFKRGIAIDAADGQKRPSQRFLHAGRYLGSVGTNHVTGAFTGLTARLLSGVFAVHKKNVGGDGAKKFERGCVEHGRQRAVGVER